MKGHQPQSRGRARLALLSRIAPLLIHRRCSQSVARATLVRLGEVRQPPNVCKMFAKSLRDC